MDNKTIERANNLKRQIDDLQTLIKGDIGLHRRGFVVEFGINFGPSQGETVYRDIRQGLDFNEWLDVEEKMTAILREVLERKQKELEGL